MEALHERTPVAPPRPERRRFTCIVEEGARRIAEGTYEIRIQKPYPEFTFIPGQSIKFDFPGLEKPRSFTIASAPEEEHLTFVFRSAEDLRLNSPLKTHLRELVKGASVTVLDAKGDCTYPETPDTPVVMLAGGVGIAPFLSMLRHAVSTEDTRQFHLLYANKTLASVSYRDDIAELERSGVVHLSVRHFITRSTEGKNIPGITHGHFTEKDIAENIGETAIPIFYAVGTASMVEKTVAMVTKCLQDAGVPPEDLERFIRSKVFKGYEDLDGA